jgi:predicted DCC family thiol-disulfide oxidoreductase YuxK
MAGRVLALPNQLPGVTERYGLTRADVDREAWTIDAAGRKYAGAASINRLLEEFSDFWPVVGKVYWVPPLRWIEDIGYRWIARNRSKFARWGVVPECDEPGIKCED